MFVSKLLDIAPDNVCVNLSFPALGPALVFSILRRWSCPLFPLLLICSVCGVCVFERENNKEREKNVRCL